MSFSKAKLKRFNDIEVLCGSPATMKHNHNIEHNTPNAAGSTITSTSTTTNMSSSTGTATTGTGTISNTEKSSSSSSTGHPERKEQIEKFFKDAVRFASSSKESKEFAIPKEVGVKEDKKSKGLRLFRTPSLPHRLRFRQNSDVTSSSSSSSTNNNGSTTASSTPLHSATTTPIKEMPKSASRLKGKEALQMEIRQKNELIESYLSQIDVLKRHVEQLKETEAKLKVDHTTIVSKTDNMIQALTTENSEHKSLNDQLSSQNLKLNENCLKLSEEIKTLHDNHVVEVEAFKITSSELKERNEKLEKKLEEESLEHKSLNEHIAKLEKDIFDARERLAAGEEKSIKDFELIENLKNTNESLISDVKQLKEQIEHDALSYAQETKGIQNQMECLRNERNTLKNDLAAKCELIRSLQEELLDKNCEIDAHCDTIRQLCREKAKYVEKEQLMDSAEEKIRNTELLAEQKVQKMESDLENAIEREKAYWRGELEKRQKLAENEIIKIELEKQDVMVLLENTNDMLRERDEKMQKYEEQLRNGLDYYINLTDNLQKQVVDLKQDVAKTITEKYNYQLTLNNTRSTVNILMDRLKKSDADVEQFKAELESVQLAKGALEQSYLTLQADMENLRKKLTETETALESLQESSQKLQQEVQIKENMFSEMLTSEEETLTKFNKIASSFQERIDTDAARYLELYNELRTKDETREVYMQDMKKALDEFATVLQFAQFELDNKEKTLLKVRDECEQLKLENISLKSKLDNEMNPMVKKENSTDLEKIEDLLIDSELRAECDKITSWLLSSNDKSVRTDSANEINELLKPSTPNNKTHLCTTPIRCPSTGKPSVVQQQQQINTPRTPRTPRTPKSSAPSSKHSPRTTPKKTVLFVGKENIPSPQKQVLKARNM